MDHLLNTISEMAVNYANELIQKNKLKIELDEALRKIAELEAKQNETNQ